MPAPKVDTIEDVQRVLDELYERSRVPRMVGGEVNAAAGTKLRGSTGWSVSRSSAGVYLLSFDAEWRDTPTAVMGTDGNVNASIQHGPSGLTGWTVSTFQSGVAADVNYNFVFFL